MNGKGKLEDIRNFRDRLDVCHQEILRFRQSDMEGGANGKKGAAADIKKVEAWKTAVVKVDKGVWDFDGQFQIFKIDAQETIDKSPKDMFKPGDIEAWLKEYGTLDTDKTAAKNHYKVIAEHRANMSGERFRLNNPC
jgi:hypothetical protein